MGRNSEEQVVFHQGSKGAEDPIVNYVPKLPGSNSRPNSMVVKKVCPKQIIPAHIIAEAISTLHGLDLRWSGPITPNEMQYVEQYVLAKYPQYSSGLIEEGDKTNLYESLYTKSSSPGRICDNRFYRASPRGGLREDLDNTKLEPSRLLDILSKKSSLQGNFESIPEIQARIRVLRHCGLMEVDYLVHFAASYKDAMMLVGESYPFFKYNCYMTIIQEEADFIREFASFKDSKLIVAPESWLDLRIKGSQLSQYFRRKCKHSPKGLFAYPAEGKDGERFSMHWVSEAHRNSWHVLFDATELVIGKDRLNLALHRPDFVLCTLESTHVVGPAKITCLLVRRKAFDHTSTGSTSPQI